MKAAEKIIVALDVATKTEALALVEQLRDQISIFKIGLQLYTAEGPEIVRAVLETGAKVFLDLKLHDIPNTVGRAVESASQLGVHMLTIHLSGGEDMIAAAAGARSESLAILGVTVLTSSNEQTLRATGVASNMADQVLRLAQLGEQAGVNGIVSSPHEIKLLRRNLARSMKLVIPGIRSSATPIGDQKRVMSAAEAFAEGADYVVIGRPVTATPNPPEALAKILSELHSSV
jgi:orotidine-5'-phosphate decarboxylase